MYARYPYLYTLDCGQICLLTLQLNGDGKIKIAYMGKILKDNKSLQAQGWREGHVVNALVF